MGTSANIGTVNCAERNKPRAETILPQVFRIPIKAVIALLYRHKRHIGSLTEIILFHWILVTFNMHLRGFHDATKL